MKRGIPCGQSAQDQSVQISGHRANLKGANGDHLTTRKVGSFRRRRSHMRQGEAGRTARARQGNGGWSPELVFATLQVRHAYNRLVLWRRWSSVSIRF